jgi:hypothetical protein
MRSAALFIYRNPLDVVASEANYYHKDGKTAFAGYLSAMTPEQRLLRLIDDPWLLGTIRDRIGGFLPWFDFPNVIPVSFEELVGADGGGRADRQQRAVWSIQLKLQVPGAPSQIAASLFDRDSPTFDAAQIGRYRSAFSDEAYRRFFALPQDFMSYSGYDGSGPDKVLDVPHRADEFRRRPLLFTELDDELPTTVQYSYLGFNIVRYRGQYFPISQSAGDVDLRAADPESRADNQIPALGSAEEARRAAEYLAIRGVVDRLDADKASAEIEAAKLPSLVLENCNEFNVLKYGGRYYAVPMRFGAFDLTTADLPALVESGDLLVADSQAGAEQLARRAPVPVDPDVPTLVRENFRGFNIIRFGGRYHAVAQPAGAVDWATDIPRLQAVGAIVSGRTASEAEAEIDATIRNGAYPVDPAVPFLFRESYRGFNVIVFGRRFYAVAQNVGPFDLSTADLDALQAAGRLFIGRTDREVEAAIEALHGRVPTRERR